MAAQTFDNILDFAIEKEQETIDLYTHAAQVAEHSESQEMFEELKEMEKSHKKMLKKMDTEQMSESETEDVPDLKISDYLLDVEFSPTMGYQEILTLAMKREESSVKLYTHMRDKFAYPNLRKLLDRLIQEEKKHKLRLEKEYDERILTDM